MPRIAALLALLILLPPGAAGQTGTDRGATATADEAEPAGPAQGTRLGVVTNFSQGWQPRMLASALDLPAVDFRDGMIWRQVERAPGTFTTDRPTAAYPARLAEAGGALTLIIAGGNPHHGGGDTPYRSADVAALGRFAAAMVQRFPAIVAVEVGNEFNGADFVNGPVREEGLEPRGAYHLAQLRAVAEQVRAVRPEVRIIGGAAHSIPAGYLWPILEQGGAGLMDALALHPYTTPIDQLRAQIGVLRRHPAARDLPLAITEFGSEDAARAPDDLVRGYAMLATLGAESVYWYPLNRRGDGMAPLIAPGGTITPAGRAFRFVQTQLTPHAARDLSPDPFTYAMGFGDRILVLWGEPRALQVTRGDIAVFDSQGRRLSDSNPMLARERALIVIGDQPFALGRGVQLGCSTLIADSFHQFAYPGDTGASSGTGEPGDPGFASALHLGDQRLDWQTLAGQQRGGVPWVPYLGRERQGAMRLTAESIVLRSASANPAQARWQYRAPAAGRFTLDVRVSPRGETAVPWTLTIGSGNEALVTETGTGPVELRESVTIGPDRPLEITLAPAAQGAVAIADYRLQLHDPARCAGSSSPNG